MPRGRRCDPVERFWSRVDKSGDCWLWLGATQGKGYGHCWNGQRLILTHRFSYEILVGPIPPGQQLDHRTTCPKVCVNPDHLRLVTNKQNHENRVGANRNNKGSGIRGVHWSKQHGKWIVRVMHHGLSHYGGLFGAIVEAEAAAIKLRNQLYTHNDLDRITIYSK